MEWREHTSVSCVNAFNEAQRWMEEVTKTSFGCNDFRAALENGLLLCDLINQLKPGLINRINRRSTTMAGLDNVSVFLKACEKLGLNESQLFHPGDLQDLSTRVTLRCEESSRRLKNVLITVYWLGRKAQLDQFYSGPHLNFKAFEGLLGLALSKALEEGAKDGGYEFWYQGKVDVQRPRPDYRRQESMDSVDSLDSQPLRVGNEGCGSDAEADQGFSMESVQPSAQKNRGYIPTALLRRKRGKENEMGCPSPLTRTFKPGTPAQVNPGWIWSKSSSDIPMMSPVRKASGENTYDVSKGVGSARNWNKDPPQRSRSTRAKDIEVKWQDELTKWKIRRRSTSLDFFKKSQEREHVITQMSIGAVTSLTETGNKCGVPERDQQSSGSSNPANSFYSTSPTSKQSHSDLRPRTRALLARSYATEAPFSPSAQAHTQGPSIGAMPASDPTILVEGIRSASLGSDAAGVTTPSLECPFSSQTQVMAQAGLELPNQISSLTITLMPNNPATTLTDAPTAAVTNGPISITNYSSSHQELSSSGHDLTSPVDQPAVDPLTERNVKKHQYQEEAQQISGRPGRGQQATNLYRYSSRSVSGSGSASLPRGFRRSEGSTRLSSAITARPFGTKPSRVSSLPRLCNVNDNEDLLWKRHTNPHAEPSEVHFSDMRVSLSLKPNSRPDFGFQTHWDSTGARVKFVQPGSPADFCPLCVGDEIVDVNGITVTQMSYDQWKDTMTSALQIGNLNMEIRRYGNKDWGTNGAGHPNQMCQSRKTLNLTAAVPMLIGRPDHQTAVSTEAPTTKSSQQNGQAVNGMACKEVDGDFNGMTNRSKDYGHIRLTNWQRRADFFTLKGGSESAISDLQVPSLNPSSSSWDLEGDRRRQERWQEEQERLLQEQYQRDQERLDAEWQRAQQDAMGGEYKRPESSCELTCRVSPMLTRPPVNGVTSHNKDVEHSTDKEWSKFNNPVSKPQKDEQGKQNDKLAERQWAEDSCDFVQLSAADRGKSKSTPTLGGLPKQAKGDQRKRKGQTLSKAEKERQQILAEMRKRTQLLNDNSWIRQRSTSACKEPVNVGVPLRRSDSLDNIPTTWRQSPGSTSASCARPQSAAGHCGPTTNCASRYSLGTEMTQRLPSCTMRDEPSAQSLPSSQQGTRLVSGRRICCVCEHVLGRGAAMVIETLGLCFHLTCFQCVECGQHLGGTEAGSQVRLRNRKPYCDLCYIQLKYGSAPSM